MKIKRILVPAMALVMMLTPLTGCEKDNTENMSSFVDASAESKNVPAEITWTMLEKMTSYPNIREITDTEFCNYTLDSGVKKGSFYKNPEGENTLFTVFSYEFVSKTLDKLSLTADSEIVKNIAMDYKDVTADNYREALINAYFELLPDDDTFNGNLLLSKAESMAMVMRAITPVKSITATPGFEEAVKCEEGSIYNTYIAYAEPMAEYIYTTASGKNLYAENFSGAMTRGEFIYMVINAIYGVDELATYNPSEAGSVNDCEKGVAWGLSGEGERDKALNLAINSKSTDENKGKAPEEIYRAVAFANENGIIGSESRWESNISKSEAIEILVNTILSYYESNPDAMYDQANGGSTEMLEVAGKALWDKQDKNDMSCTEEEFIADYVEMLASGATEEQFAEGIDMDYSIKWAEEEAKRIEEAQKKAEEEAKKAEEEAAKQEEQQEVVYDEPDYSYEEDNSYYEEPVVEEYNEPVYEEPAYEDNSGSSGGGLVAEDGSEIVWGGDLSGVDLSDVSIPVMQ